MAAEGWLCSRVAGTRSQTAICGGNERLGVWDAGVDALAASCRESFPRPMMFGCFRVVVDTEEYRAMSERMKHQEKCERVSRWVANQFERDVISAISLGQLQDLSCIINPPKTAIVDRGDWIAFRRSNLGVAKRVYSRFAQRWDHSPIAFGNMRTMEVHCPNISGRRMTTLYETNFTHVRETNTSPLSVVFAGRHSQLYRLHGRELVDAVNSFDPCLEIWHGAYERLPVDRSLIKVIVRISYLDTCERLVKTAAILQALQRRDFKELESLCDSELNIHLFGNSFKRFRNFIELVQVEQFFYNCRRADFNTGVDRRKLRVMYADGEFDLRESQMLLEQPSNEFASCWHAYVESPIAQSEAE